MEIKKLNFSREFASKFGYEYLLKKFKKIFLYKS